MQKRSDSLEIHFAPIRLNPAFPLCGGEPFVQHDHPIRFLHAHECLELGFCFSGSGIFMVGDKVLPFGAGDVSFIPQNEFHLARSVGGTTSEWTWIYLDPVRLVTISGEERTLLDPTPFSGSDFSNILSPATSPQIVAVVRRMVNELRQHQPHYQTCLRALAFELMALMYRQHKPKAPTDRVTSGMERIAPALQIISRDFAEPLRVAELAQACNLSEPSLRRLFQHTMGRSPRDYWLDVRLNMASALLQTDAKSILQISQEVGFESLSSFNRLFLKRFGQSPRQWRTRSDS